MGELAMINGRSFSDEKLDLGSLSLAELTDRANVEHALALDAAVESVVHAIRAGEVLLALQSRISGGAWTEWLEKNFSAHRGTAARYMRLAQYRDLLFSAPEPFLSQRAAISYLYGLPTRNRQLKTLPGWTADQARKLKESGMELAGIAEHFGVSISTVKLWLSPKQQSRSREENRRRKASARRRRQAEAALRREKERKAVAAQGGKIAELYSQIRKATQLADQITAGTEGQQIRAGAGQALPHLYRAEDSIASALRAGLDTGQPRKQSTKQSTITAQTPATN